MKVSAQADISMATHWNNRANYNPAFIARTEYLYLFFNTRKQWVGINGAPVVFNLQVSEYINSFHSAFGLSLVEDRIGAAQAFNPMLTYAFRIAKKEQWSLAMGLSAGMFFRTINGSLFEAENTSDPSLFYDYEKRNQPDINVGFEFQNNHFIYGISSTHLFSIGKSNSSLLNTNHRYGYAIYKNSDMRLLSYSFGMQVVNRNSLSVLEGNFSFRLKHQSRLFKGSLLRGPQEILDFGFACRTSRQITLLCGVMISPYLRMGYAYDQSLFSKFSRNQTHEIMLEYRIPSRSASSTVQCGKKEFWYN